MQDKTIRIIIKIVEITIGIAIIIKDVLLNGGDKNGKSGNSEKK